MVTVVVDFMEKIATLKSHDLIGLSAMGMSTR